MAHSERFHRHQEQSSFFSALVMALIGGALGFIIYAMVLVL